MPRAWRSSLSGRLSPCRLLARRLQVHQLLERKIERLPLLLTPHQLLLEVWVVVQDVRYFSLAKVDIPRHLSLRNRRLLSPLIVFRQLLLRNFHSLLETYRLWRKLVVLRLLFWNAHFLFLLVEDMLLSCW